MNKPVVICGFKRSPMHFASKGELAKTRPDDMAASVVKALVEDTKVKAEDIEDLIMGRPYLPQFHLRFPLRFFLL